MGSDVYDAVLDLVNETEQMLKVVLLPNAYGWPERHEGINQHGRQFIAAWNEVRRLWDTDLEGRLAGRRTDAVAFRNAVLAGCWLRVAKDVGLRVLAALQRLHDSQLGRPLVLKVRLTPRCEPEAPILAFSAEDIPAIVERFRLEPAFSWPEAPEKLAAAIRRDFAPLIVGIRQERAWAGARAPDDGATTGRGVSLQDAAERIKPDDPDGQKETVRQYRNLRKPKLPPPIGKCPNHAQRNLYEPAAILRFIKKVEGDVADADFGLSAYFRKVSRLPRGKK